MSYLPVNFAGFGLVSDNAKPHNPHRTQSSPSLSTPENVKSKLGRSSSLRQIPCLNGNEDDAAAAANDDKHNKKKSTKDKKSTSNGANTKRRKKRKTKDSTKQRPRKGSSGSKNNTSRWTRGGTNDNEAVVSTPLSLPRRSCSSDLLPFSPAASPMSMPTRTDSRIQLLGDDDEKTHCSEDEPANDDRNATTKGKGSDRGKVTKKQEELTTTPKKKKSSKQKLNGKKDITNKLSTESPMSLHEACRWGDRAPHRPRRHSMIQMPKKASHKKNQAAADSADNTADLEYLPHRPRRHSMETAPSCPSRQTSHRMSGKQRALNDDQEDNNNGTCAGKDANPAATNTSNIHLRRRNSHDIDDLVLVDDDDDDDDEEEIEEVLLDEKKGNNSFTFDRLVTKRKYRSGINIEPLESSCQSSITLDSERQDFSDMSLCNRSGNFQIHSLLGESKLSKSEEFWGPKQTTSLLARTQSEDSGY